MVTSRKTPAPPRKRAATAKSSTTKSGSSTKRASSSGVAARGGRDALVEAVLAELSEKGPANIFPNDISVALGLSKSLVNFHFGGRDGLIAEAMALGYERYVDTVWAAAQAAGDDPVARLMAWIDAQYEWTIANAGLAAALNFPLEAAALDGEQSPGLAARMAATGSRSLENTRRLVHDAHVAVRRKGRSVEPDPVRVGLDAGLIGWMTLGMSVFVAGRHLPTRNAFERQYTEIARQRMKDTVLEMLRR
jgi:AcrR family transcriptional regulator